VPVIPIDLCLAGGDITDVRVRPGGMWVSGVLTEVTDGAKRSVVRLWHVTSGETVDVLADPEPATGRGLSGGVHRWSRDGSRIVVALRDGGLALCSLVGSLTGAVSEIEVQIIADEGWFTTPCFSLVNDGVWAVRNWHDVVFLRAPHAAPTDGVWTQEVYEHDGDFAWDVDEWDGSPSFHAWNRPEMPWTQSRIHSVYTQDGVAVQQPRVSSDGRSIGFLCDVNGALNIAISTHDDIHVIDDECEHGGPTWGSGSRTWCFNSDATMVAYTRNESGYGSLWVRGVGTSGAPLRVGKAVHGCLSWEGNTLVAIRSGARTAPEVVAYNMSSLMLPQAMTPTKKVIARGGDPRWYEEAVRDELVEPEVITVPATDEDPEIVIRLYVPHSPNGVLLSWAHGGPTDQWQVSFMPRHAFWLSRGFTIAVIDYRGSSGHGREFQCRLHGQWGDGDARDMVRATQHVHKHCGYTPERTILIGASAGALAVLGAVVSAHRDNPGNPIASAVVVSYPVVDLWALAQSDDPFEAHYVPTLVGASQSGDPVWEDRSPHCHPEAFVALPILVFHGDSDTVVGLEHSLALQDAVTSVGGEVSLHVMKGEGHGFRDVGNQRFEYETTEKFLNRFL
jgi:dipeptidyl aminopeptidase/acylaminoacyl peptidase